MQWLLGRMLLGRLSVQSKRQEPGWCSIRALVLLLEEAQRR
mgnify:CR=1 FL=1